MPGNKPSDTGRVVTYHTVTTDYQVIGPNQAAVEDWEKELRRRIRRVVNNQAMAKRHGVEVRAPGLPHAPKDMDFWVLTSATPPNRRTR